jgi:hypothetical protein
MDQKIANISIDGCLELKTKKKTILFIKLSKYKSCYFFTIIATLKY